MGKATIEVRDLRKTYREGMLMPKRFEALKGVSFDVLPGEVFGLLGPNGAGKTTFIKILLGIVRKSAGEAFLLGRSAGDRRGRVRIGYLPEQLRIPRYHNANTALEYYGSLSGMSRSVIRAKAPELLEQVGLTGRERDPVRKYSKGMLQRLGLAQAILHDPDVVFLDEPTDGLDPVGRSDVRQLLRRLKEAGKTVFLNSHLLQEVEMVCDRVAILDKGELLEIGKPEELVPESEGLEVVLDVLAAEAELQAVLAGREVKSIEVINQDHRRLNLALADQPAVDQLIDQLRERRISILAFGRRRQTLEDLFLRIIKRSRTPA